MFAVLGDIHGLVSVLEEASRIAKEKGAEALIQVGDAGFDASFASDLQHIDLHIPVYAMQGNHEDYGWLDKFDATRGKRLYLRARTGAVVALPRVDMLEIAGKRIACLGGAGSIDKNTRIQYNMGWFEQEVITDADGQAMIDALRKVGTVDYLLTHTPPQSVITKHFNTYPRWPRVAAAFGVPLTWKDSSAAVVDRVWAHTGHVQMFCGHMHESAQVDSCRVLNINELVCV